MILEFTWPSRKQLHSAMLCDAFSMKIVEIGNARLRSAGLASVRYFREPEDLNHLNPRASAPTRHGLGAQRMRRAAIAIARNYLAFVALGGEEYQKIKWVLWLDSDLWFIPPTLISDLRSSKVDLVVPVCYCKPGTCGSSNPFVIYDRNSWRDTKEAHALLRHLERSGTISDDVIVVRGYEDPYIPEYILIQRSLALKHKPLYLDDLNHSITAKHNGTLVELDGIGATAILLRADLHRRGLIFPAFAVNHTIESEGMAQIARRMGVIPYGRTDISIYHA